MATTRIFGNWRYYRSGSYIYCWSTQKQHHFNNRYVSFVRRWHKTKSQYVTVESKTVTHSTRSKAKERAMRLAGVEVATKNKKDKVPVGENEAYCMKCKGPRPINDPEEIKRTTKGTTRYALQGSCSECGTNVTKFISKRRECPGCLKQLKEADFPQNDYMCYECRY